MYNRKNYNSKSEGNVLPEPFVQTGLITFLFYGLIPFFSSSKPFFMSFRAKFKVGGREDNILSCSYALKQETDATGRPSSITRGGKITLTVESTGDSTYFEWMTNNFERKDGTIVFIKRDNDAKHEEVKFTEGYMTEYRKNFDAGGQNPITETFTISARAIEVGTGKHENEWVK